MKNIKKGDSAISFVTTDYLGNSIDLNQYKGKRVLLTFFRVASCPFCNLRVNQLINRQSEFEEQNIQIIAFFASTDAEIQKYAGKQTPPFPIIADPKLKMYMKYGIEQSFWGMMKSMLGFKKLVEVMFSGFFNLKAVKEKPLIPADFLIDENGMVVKAHYGKDFSDHITIEDVLSWK